MLANQAGRLHAVFRLRTDRLFQPNCTQGTHRADLILTPKSPKSAALWKINFQFEARRAVVTMRK
jgi:hypothetical protein